MMFSSPYRRIYIDIYQNNRLSLSVICHLISILVFSSDICVHDIDVRLRMQMGDYYKCLGFSGDIVTVSDYVPCLLLIHQFHVIILAPGTFSRYYDTSVSLSHS